MSDRLTGLDVNVRVGDLEVTFKEVGLTIDDSSKANEDNGRPNGNLRGKVSAGGDITVDTANLKLIIAAAATAGSFQQMPPFDINFFAKTAADELDIEAFECKFKISDLLKANTGSEDQLIHKLDYYVTGKEFVSFDGVPYLNPDNIQRLG